MNPEVVCDRPELEAFQLQIDGQLLWRGYDPAARARLVANNEAIAVDLFEVKALDNHHLSRLSKCSIDV